MIQTWIVKGEHADRKTTTTALVGPGLRKPLFFVSALPKGLLHDGRDAGHAQLDQ